MSNSKVFWAFLGGAIAGAALGVLFTSEKGSEIRKDISDKAKDLANKIIDKAEDLVDDFKTKVTDK